MPDHGTRSTYQAGCHCTRCRAANAAAERARRLQRAKGQSSLGMTISAVETWRKIRQLKTEGLAQQDIAQGLGLKRPILEISKKAVTVRTALRIRRLYQAIVGETPEAASPPV